MTRVQTAAAILPLQLGVGVLLALMVVMSALLARTLLVWGTAHPPDRGRALWALPDRKISSLCRARASVSWTGSSTR